MKSGVGYHIYAAGKSMAPHLATYNADGDLLIVPQTGTLDITTEMGRLLVRPNEICVIPRGIRYRVDLADKTAPIRGYTLELTRATSRCPSSARSGPTASPTRATSRSPSPRTPTTRRRNGRSTTSSAGSYLPRRRPTRPSTLLRGRAGTTRTNTISAASTRSARSHTTTRTRRSTPC
jgi:hypothetical protein